MQGSQAPCQAPSWPGSQAATSKRVSIEKVFKFAEFHGCCTVVLYIYCTVQFTVLYCAVPVQYIRLPAGYVGYCINKTHTTYLTVRQESGKAGKRRTVVCYYINYKSKISVKTQISYNIYTIIRRRSWYTLFILTYWSHHSHSAYCTVFPAVRTSVFITWGVRACGGRMELTDKRVWLMALVRSIWTVPLSTYFITWYFTSLSRKNPN